MVDCIIEDETFKSIKETLQKFNKYNYFEKVLNDKINEINYSFEPDKSEWKNYINNKQLKLDIEYIPKPKPYKYSL